MRIEVGRFRLRLEPPDCGQPRPCEYVTGWPRDIGATTCGRPTTSRLPDVAQQRDVPICEYHAAFSRPPREWPLHDFDEHPWTSATT